MFKWFARMLKTPKTQVGFLLTLIFITAFFNNPSLKSIFVFLLSVGSALFFDLLFLKTRGVKLFFPSAGLVTGSIIGLLTSPFAAWYIPVIIAAVAMLSKNFIRLTNRHIFNPAAFSLFFGALILGVPVSWWAVSWQQFRIQNVEFIIYFLILVSPAFVSMIRMKRYRITLSFFTVYIIINNILNSEFLILNSVLDPTTLFFATVLLPEPLTSPNNHKRQIIFGVFVALVSLIISLWNFISINPFIIALFIGNAVFFRYR